MDQYQQFIHKSRYARWRDDLGRRETWDETVRRYIDFFHYRNPAITSDVALELYQAIYDMEVMPSMRCLMTAGPALERDNVAGFNCSYVAVDHQRVFDEIMYVLMCGTGVGFSVERQYINRLPEVPEELYETNTCISVSDSKIGWASAYRELIAMLYSGRIPKWDTSRVRPAGSRLATFGGRASGPEPLEDLFRFTIEVFKGAVGRKLSSIEVHDVVCKIAAIVVVGGVRRSALISLSNLTDQRMAGAKSGQWWVDDSQRALSNNSVCYTEHPDMGAFLKEWLNLYESKSGERGIFNRKAAQAKARANGRRDPGHDFGTNPCSEIILRSKQFCNLSEVIVRPDDDFNDLKRKVRIATIIGTLQATLTNFRYLRPIWKQNTEEEALLGVSLTGIMDHPFLSGSSSSLHYSETVSWDTNIEDALRVLKEVAIETNEEWAAKLGVNPSVAITCVKPSGTVSQLVDSSSGIHPRYSDYYIRTVRNDKKDPLSQVLIDSGIPHEEDVTNPSSWVFSFYRKSPRGSVLRNDRTAVEQLDLWKLYAEHWCEHKPSVTVYVREREWADVAAWVYRNFDICSGISFLPHSDHIYRQAPYQEITKEAYDAAVAVAPQINWDLLMTYEKEGNNTVQHELACSAGVCEL